jgi:hypothetical protein
MFTEKTMLILGAGASCHLDFPTGEKLISDVKQSKYHNENSQTRRLSRLLNEMQPLSIDMFLSYHPELEKVGKDLIAHEIIKYEDNKGVVEENWYRFLIDAIISQCKKPEDILISNENLTIATFNYDLSLEYYLYSRLKKISFFEKYIDDFLKNLNIIHIYGQLGCFKWHEEFYKKVHTSEPIIRSDDSYGSSRTDFVVLARGIEIIGLRKWDNNILPKHVKIIRKHLFDAVKIYLLGFGFYEENMELVNLNRQMLQSGLKMFYYTNFGNQEKIERKLLKRQTNYKTCGRFIKSINSVYEALSKDFELNE